MAKKEQGKAKKGETSKKGGNEQTKKKEVGNRGLKLIC